MAAAVPRGLPVPVVVLSLTAALVVSITCGLALGAAGLPFGQVLHLVRAGVLGGWIESGEVSAYQIVWEVRLPRVLLAAVVGAGLSAVGAASQALVRNALADPFVLGVSSGASVGATAVIVLGVFGALGVHALSAAAFLGALGATALVHLAARSRGAVTPLRLVLTGTALAYGFSAITTVLVFLAPHGDAARSALFWLLGGLGGVTWASLPVAAAVTAAGLVFLLLTARPLDALAMGDETASALGVDPSSLRRKLFVVCALVTGCLVAVSGAVGFVGLMVPHVTRMVVGAGHRALLAVAPLAGAVLLVWVDLLARTVVAPQELPLGVLTSAIGVPVFVWLMRRRAYVFGGR